MEIKIKSISSDFLDDSEKIELLSSIHGKLKEAGVIAYDANDESFDAYLILTGGTERKTIELINSDQLQNVILLTHNGNNSLAAALEISAYLNNDFVNIIPIEDCDFNKKLYDALNYELPLTGKRIGAIGKPSDWLIASSHSHEVIKKSWGAEIVQISIKELTDLVDELEIEKSTLGSFLVKEPDEDDLINSEVVYLALKALIKQYQLDGLTIRCFDLLSNKKMTACYALAKLNAEGIPAGCEGDIPSIIGMIWVQQKTGKIPWMANPSRIDLKNSRLVLAHCTAPLNYLNNILLRSHFESGIAVGIEGDLDFQKVTLLRIGGRNLEKKWISGGKLTRHLKEENLCRTQIEVKLPIEKLKELLDKPLGNHLLVIPTDMAELSAKTDARANS